LTLYESDPPFDFNFAAFDSDFISADYIMERDIRRNGMWWGGWAFLYR
jgi:hypothetical protein